MIRKCTKQISKEGPYEKFLAKGAEHLTDAELLGIVIRTGTVGENSVSLGQKILDLSSGRANGILGLHHLSIADLKGIRGIGEVKAVKIKCIAELSNRIATTTAKESVQFDKPETIARYYMEQMRHKETEQTILLLLDGRNHLIGDCVISTGTVNASLLSAREVMIMALMKRAVYLILLHNHPSGDPTPSKMDLKVTKKIKEAAELIEIPLLDHIIIGDHKYVSFREQHIF